MQDRMTSDWQSTSAAGELWGRVTGPTAATVPAERNRLSFLEQLERFAPWPTWASRLAGYRRFRQLRRLGVDRTGSTLTWSLPPHIPLETADWVRALIQLRRRRHAGEPRDWNRTVAQWTARTEGRTFDADGALEHLAVLHVLDRLAVRLTGDNWWQLFVAIFQRTLTAVEQWGTKPDWELNRRAVGGQMWAVELPVTLAFCFPKLDRCRWLGRVAGDVFSQAIHQLLDTDGMPPAELLPWLPELLATWTRTQYLQDDVPDCRISADAQREFAGFVRQTLRCMRADGCFMMTDSSTGVDCGPLVSAALTRTEDRKARRSWRALGGRGTNSKRLLRPARHSPWGQLALLRSSWSPDALYASLAYPNGQAKLELGVGRRVLVNGDTLPEIRIDGQCLIAGEAEEVCWHVDDEAQYVELEIDLAEGWSLQRQLLLAPEDGFVYLADAVVGPHSAEIDYKLRLPLGAGVLWQSDPETREAQLRQGQHAATVFPLALPEWRIDPRCGDLRDGTLWQHGHGQRLYAPLLVDLDRQRRKNPRTWRQLTVAEQLEIVPRHVAVAYRVQIGARQWVVYRSLAPKGNRTFLGQNLSTEFFVGRFLPDGETESIIEVE